MTNLIEIQNLSKSFRLGKRSFNALDNINFSIKEGETLGLVGESGCGKSTLARALLYIDPPTQGKVIYERQDLSLLSKKKMKELRQQMQMIFQDPYASLNPRMTVKDIISEPLIIHKMGTTQKRNERIVDLLNHIGLPINALGRFPHEFSGGQRQRIGIARALAMNPKFIIFDEPLSALDVSVQAQIVNLLKVLKQKMGLTSLFIAHDLAMIKYISDTVAVLYRGQLMEMAPAESLYQTPLHPYTKALMAAIPIPDPNNKQSSTVGLKGELLPPHLFTKGCPFQNRCPIATRLCHDQRPDWREVKPGHFVACHAIETSKISTG